VVEKMAATRKTGKESGEPGMLRSEWLDRLSSLLKLVKSWAEELDWSTRQIEKTMKDSRLGTYEAPALIMQKGATRVLLDPIARFAPGVDGVVDLYLMPAYDDIASLYFVNGEWRLHYMFPGTPSVPTIREAESSPLSKDTFAQVLDEMTDNASEAL
jgi:hypothetical protein